MKTQLQGCLLFCMMVTCVMPAVTIAEEQTRDAIKAYCIDFNWGEGGPNGFARPGLWADADPAKHVAGYKALGANVMQTFDSVRNAQGEFVVSPR